SDPRTTHRRVVITALRRGSRAALEPGPPMGPREVYRRGRSRAGGRRVAPFTPGRAGRRRGVPAIGGSAREAREGTRACVDRCVVELLLDAQQLVVLGDALGACRGPGLDLAAVGGDSEVRDRHVLGLPGAV